jgi:capsular polysaccharide biosynthesis protein
MPTVKLLEECGVPRKIPIVVSSALGNMPFFREMIQRGALRERNWIIQDGFYVRAREVIFARTEWPSPEMLNGFLDDIEAPNGSHLAKRRVFVIRNNRRLTNFRQLLPEIEKCDFELIYPEQLSFAQQIQLFSETQVLCGVGGAALTNAIFGRGNCLQILEICPLAWKDLFFYSIAKTCGHGHRYLVGTNFETCDRASDFSVDPNAFKEFLSRNVSAYQQATIHK